MTIISGADKRGTCGCGCGCFFFAESFVSTADGFSAATLAIDFREPLFLRGVAVFLAEGEVRGRLLVRGVFVVVAESAEAARLLAFRTRVIAVAVAAASFAVGTAFGFLVRSL